MLFRSQTPLRYHARRTITQNTLFGFPIVLLMYRHRTCKNKHHSQAKSTCVGAANPEDATKQREGKSKTGLTFCQFFFSDETRKLTLIWMFCWICFSSIDRLPTATPMHRTFLSWNLIVAFVSFTFDSRESW